LSKSTEQQEQQEMEASGAMSIEASSNPFACLSGERKAESQAKE
jgi:hypothetical protein